jgi:hypothetical protein
MAFMRKGHRVEWVQLSWTVRKDKQVQGRSERHGLFHVPASAIVFRELFTKGCSETVADYRASCRAFARSLETKPS